MLNTKPHQFFQDSPGVNEHQMLNIEFSWKNTKVVSSCFPLIFFFFFLYKIPSFQPDTNMLMLIMHSEHNEPKKYLKAFFFFNFLTIQSVSHP